MPSERHFDLVDQVRMRAKSDGIAVYRLDEILDTGNYFRREWPRRSRVNLEAISRAIEFFGGTLVIDWHDFEARPLYRQALHI